MTAMSRAQILAGMREATERRKRADRAQRRAADLASARERLARAARERAVIVGRLSRSTPVHMRNRRALLADALSGYPDDERDILWEGL